MNRASCTQRPYGRRPGSCSSRLGAILVGVLALALLSARPALASPWWRLSSRAAPTNLPPGGQGRIRVTANDLGDAGVVGTTSPVTIEDTLPAGLTVSGTAASIHAHRSYETPGEAANWSCSLAGPREVSCTTTLAIPPYEGLEVEIPVEVTEPSGTVASLPNTVSVQGGEAEGAGGETVPGLSLTRPVQVSGEAVTFGLEEGGYAVTPEDEGGSLDDQAGSHPFQLTTTIDFNETTEMNPLKGLLPAAPALTKDLSVELPPGLLGNVTAAAQCSEGDFSAEGTGSGEDTNLCPAASVVGVASVTVNIPNTFGYLTHSVPLFNLVPAYGEPARFGFEIYRVPVILETSVRTGGDYGVSVEVDNASEAAQILGSQVTFWGVPGASAHDQSRGWACLLDGAWVDRHQPCEAPSPRSTTPLLTLPTACTGQLSTSMEGISWAGDQLASGYVPLQNSTERLEGLEGCGALPFDPSVAVRPAQVSTEGLPEASTSSASTPTGLSVDVKVPQATTLEANQLGEADVQSASVTLPEGVLLSPSAANGLAACSEEQVGYLGGGGTDPLAPGAREPLRFSTERAECPEGSKVGIVHIKTPLLNEELEGAVYLAAQSANPFGSLVALYIVAENPALGLRVKLAGEVVLNGSTGQITTTFQSTPQVPFEDLKLQLFGGQRGSLTTPPLCGSYTTTTSFTAWSGAVREPTSTEPFNIASGPDGAPCPSNPLPFGPSFGAGVSSLQAGGFTPFSLTVGDPDGDQPLSGVAVHLPPGLEALLSTVTPCEEPPQGQEWACGPESLIGHSTAWSGLGSEPYALGGTAYLTVGYGGAPFGLLVVTPAVAGPFNLGDVDVRSKIEVNPDTAAVTVTSDPFPQFVKGVPVQLKRINVTIDRGGFTFNPTNCSAMAVAGTLTGAGGASEPVSSAFQVAGCQSLPFAPKLTAAVAGHASKADGTSLTVKVTSAGLGQANIAKLDIQLPKALSSRLTTLQRACLEAAFNTNPASCDAGSVIGRAIVHTPALKSPLTGPAYLVSHGGAEFPDLEFVLQGEGITIVVDSKTYIDNKTGITYSRLEAVPDAPFTSFEAELPAGPDSVLAANVPESEHYDLCKASLQMPITITGQNGAVLEQTIEIAATGCDGVLPAKARLTKAQLLAKALKACRKDKHKHKRLACEWQAHKRYSAKASRKHARRGRPAAAG